MVYFTQRFQNIVRKCRGLISLIRDFPMNKVYLKEYRMSEKGKDKRMDQVRDKSNIRETTDYEVRRI